MAGLRTHVNEPIEDRSAPIRKLILIDAADALMHEANESYNRYALTERESHGRRTKLRVSFEVWGRLRKYTGYKRLRGKHVVLSCPTSEQAELVIETIHQLCAALDGKHLTKRDEQPNAEQRAS